MTELKTQVGQLFSKYFHKGLWLLGCFRMGCLENCRCLNISGSGKSNPNKDCIFSWSFTCGKGTPRSLAHQLHSGLGPRGSCQKREASWHCVACCATDDRQEAVVGTTHHLHSPPTALTRRLPPLQQHHKSCPGQCWPNRSHVSWNRSTPMEDWSWPVHPYGLAKDLFGNDQPNKNG